MLKGETVQSSTQGVSPEKISKVEEKSRKTGIDVVGDASFGTHFCLFYETKEDLIDVLVPYFKAGLESNEFCMWVTSEPLSEEEAKEAMRRAVPNFDGYVERGQIEIVPYTEWYLKGGVFNFQRVLNGWVEKLNQALAKGYDGMRVTGNTAWLEKRDWKNFVDYEQEINRVVGKYQMIVICTYSLEKCAASEILDVVRNHQFAVIKREGKWELIESSEIKRAEASLWETEERYMELTEDISDVFFAMDKDFRYTYWNKASEKLTGISAKDAVGKSLTEVFPDVKGTKIEQVYLEALRTQKPQSYLNKYQLGGKDYVFEINAYPTKTGLSVFAKDITEYKKAEDKLEESEEKYRSLVENSKDSIVIIDLKGNVQFVNKATEELTGYTSGNGAPLNVRKITPLRYWSQSLAMLRKARGGKSIPYFESMIRRKDGRLIPVESGGQAVFRDGKAVGVQIITRDISERKMGEEKIRESEEKYRTQFEEALDSIVVADSETGIIIDCNREATKLVGREKSEIVGNHQRILHPPEVIKGEFSRTFKQHRKEKEGQVLETQVITKNGEIKDVAIKANVFKLGDKRILQGIFRDITEQKKDEKALQEAEERYRKTIVNANVGIITYGPEGEVKVFNPKMEEMTGFKRTEIPTLVNWFEKLYPNEEERRKVRDKWFKRMSEEGEVKEGHAIITTKEGKRRNFLFNGVQLESGDSIAFAQDITEQKQAQQTLSDSEEKFRNIVENSSDVVMLTLPDGTVSYISPACFSVLGYNPEDLMGTRPSIFHPDDLEKAKLAIEKLKQNIP